MIDDLTEETIETVSSVIEPSNIGISIVKIAALFLVGVVMLSGISGSVHISSTASSGIHFAQQPADGDTVTIDSHVFEFDSNGNVASGHISVTIGDTLAETSVNFRTELAAYYAV